MTEKPIQVLFMDDEPSSEIVQVAVAWMEDEGFAVDLVESMGQAIESYYDKFYDVFVLDIDMSHIPEEEEGDGVGVLKRFISLHNQTRVIMFSGAGTTPHWFAAANAHCWAYVHKNEKNSVKKLVDLIRAAAGEPARPLARPEGTCPKKVLVYCEEDAHQDAIEAAVKNRLGSDWDIETAEEIDQVDRLLKEGGEYGLVLLFQPVFELYPDEKGGLRSILSRSPAPQAIVGCAGKDEHQHSILFLANHHPFRMINIADDNWPAHLEDALESAVVWHGQREIFQADSEALRRMNISLPPEALDEWNFSPQEMEELYAAFVDEEKEG